MGLGAFGPRKAVELACRIGELKEASIIMWLRGGSCFLSPLGCQLLGLPGWCSPSSPGLGPPCTRGCKSVFVMCHLRRGIM
jgi:hypothetical protein